MSSKLFLIVLFALGPIANAAPIDAKYFTLSSAKTEELETLDPNPSRSPLQLELPMPALSLGGVDIDEIINLGKQVWDVIVANKPVSNIQTDTASALPKGITAWQDLAGWQAPRTKIYRSTFKNGYGINVVDFTYRIHYIYGGSYKNAGRYLTEVTVEPADLTVAWGYSFAMKASVPSITNAGTIASPIAAAELEMNWNVDTVVKHEEQSMSYYMRGDGVFQDLSVEN